MSGDTPAELVRLLSAQDDTERDAAWDAFVARYSKLLLLISREYGGTHDDAMDRYAVVLARLREDDFRRLRVWAADQRSALTTWLGVIARRATLDELRRRYGRQRESGGESADLRRQRRRLSDLVTEELLPETDAADTHGTIASAELELRRAELRQRLDQCVKTLSPDDQLLLALRFRDDKTAADIARILGLPTAFHVYRRLDRLAARLRQALRRHGVEDPVP
jgi:RNA polymerase sigma factor (sigma-70 family)